MPSLKISIIESVYLIFMFLFFKTTMDFNVLRSPTGWWFEHLVGDHYGLRICPFGRVAIFALIAILIARHYVKIAQLYVNTTLVIAFILSIFKLRKTFFYTLRYFNFWLPPQI